MQKFVLTIITIALQIACVAQQRFSTKAYNFPDKVKEVMVSEFEINRVTGDKNLFKTSHYFFENDLIKKLITVFDHQKTTTATFSYNQNNLLKYECIDGTDKWEEIYSYNKKGLLTQIKNTYQQVLSSNIFFNYDHKNRIIKKIAKETDGTTSCIETYTYNTNNNYKKKVLFVYQTQNAVADEYIFINNVEVKSITFDDQKKKYITHKKYDSHHNIISIDNPITNFVNKYNDQGLLVQTNILTNDNLLYTNVEYNYIF